MKKLLKQIKVPDLIWGILFFVLLMVPSQSNSQAYSANNLNFPFDPGVDYLGWDASLEPEQLNIWHRTPGQPIIFRTNSVERMRMLVDGTVAIKTTTNDEAKFNIIQQEKSPYA